jgi:hypothetical protein
MRPCHGLRHSSITNGAAAVISPEALMQRAGHSDYATRRYVDLAGERFGPDADLLDARHRAPLEARSSRRISPNDGLASETTSSRKPGERTLPQGTVSHSPRARAVGGLRMLIPCRRGETMAGARGRSREDSWKRSLFADEMLGVHRRSLRRPLGGLRASVMKWPTTSAGFAATCLRKATAPLGVCASIKRQVRRQYGNTRREQICQPMRSLASVTRWWFGLTQNRPPHS